MKKKLFLVLSIFFTPIILFADIIPIDMVTSYRSIEGKREGTLGILYDTEDETYTLAFTDAILGTDGIVMNKKQRDSLYNMINKFSEWEEIAKKDNDTLDKTIGTLTNVSGFFIDNTSIDEHKMHFSKNTIDIELVFRTNSKNEYFLGFIIPEYTSNLNDFITKTPKPKYLSTINTTLLYFSLPDFRLINATKEHEKRKKQDAKKNEKYK